MTFEEEFSEASQYWEIDKLYLDLADVSGKALSPSGKKFLRGILCGYSREEIAKKLKYQSKDISATVRQTLSKEVYPAIENLVNSGNKINWRKTSKNSVSQLLKDYRKKLENLPPTPTEIQIDWHGVCAKMLEKQQTTEQLKRQATQIGCEIEVFVELGLVERKLQQRRTDRGMEKLGEKEIITRTYEYNEFLRDVIQGKKNKFTAIVGEAGSGKTTWLDKIANNLKNTNDLYICIPLGELQKKTLEEYILKKWLLNAMLLIDSDIDSETQEKLLIKRLQKDEVWLLLDGVDEIGETSAAQTLRNIQQQLTGFLSEARVVLTCRTNLWDVNFNHPLSGFETYKTLEFQFEQVDDFIHQWFVKAENEKRGEKLEQKLKESRHNRIYDLVRNPLRLSLLCQIFYFDENAELPETKAGLYQQFIRYFYEWKPEKMDIDLNVQPNLKNQLHQALGRVALAGLDSSERFRLSESLISKEIQDDNLLKLALDFDLLLLIDREVKTGELVYRFLHPTFQEYFASLVIPNWEFLFNHIPGDVSNSTYRIFDSYWQEVALMWMESDNCSAADGEKIIKNMDDFQSDECLEFYSFQILPFLVASLYRLGHHYQYKKILENSVSCLIDRNHWKGKFNKFVPLYSDDLFLNTLKVLPSLSSNLLNRCLNSEKYNDNRFKIIKILFEISPNKEAVLEKLVGFLHSNDPILLEVSEIILKYDKFHAEAISKLIELFLNSQDKTKCIKIIDILLKNKSINTEIITEKVLEKLLQFTLSENEEILEITISKLNDLSDWGVIKTSNNDELLEILIHTMTKSQLNYIIILQIVDLLEKQNIDNEKYHKALLDIMFSNRIEGMFITRIEKHLVVFCRALECLSTKNLSSKFINQIVNLASTEKSLIRYLSLILFIKEHSLSNPESFNQLEVIKNIILIPQKQQDIQKSKNRLSNYKLIARIVSSNQIIFNLLKTIPKKCNDKNIIESANTIIDYIHTNRLKIETKKISKTDDCEFEKKIENMMDVERYNNLKEFLLGHNQLILKEFNINFLYGIEYAIGTNDIETIKLILEKIKLSQDSEFNTTCLYSLKKAGAFSIPQILKKAINFIVVMENQEIPCQVAITLTCITEVEQLKVMVANLKEYVRQDFYVQEEKSVQNEVYNYDITRYILANYIVWHCAQHMSYQDFYNAWHSLPSIADP